MASIETELIYLLKNESSITDLVSTRIYPGVILQGASMPAITYQQLSGIRDEVMAGPSGQINARFQIQCWSDTYEETRDISNAVRVLLDGYDGDANGVEIQAIHLIDESDSPQFPAGTDVIKRYAKRLDFNIWFLKAA